MALVPPAVWFAGLASPLVAALIGLAGLCHLLVGGRFARLQGLVALAVAAVILLGSHRLALYYPVLVNFLLLILWGYSRVYPPTIIERLARAGPQTPPRERRYMQRLTLAWCGIFAFNGSVALVTTRLPDLTAWVLWNGVGAYLLVGGFALAELLVRRRLRRMAGDGVTT